MSAPSPIRGTCLRGGVAFQLIPPTELVAHCHCRTCRMSHGAGFVTWTGVPRERFQLLQGAELITWYATSPWIEWGFCRTCGSSMLNRVVAEGHPDSPRIDLMDVTVASLIDPIDHPPTMHLSYEEHVPWLRVAGGLPKYRGKSEERIDDEG